MMIDCEAHKNNKKVKVKRIQSAFNLKPIPLSNNKDSLAHFNNTLTVKANNLKSNNNNNNRPYSSINQFKKVYLLLLIIYI
jgi:hypothetical protein